MATSDDLVAVKECDYLDEDKPLRGQNFVCMSFLNPEDVLKDKEVYYFEKFLKQFSGDVKQLFASLKEKFPDAADIIGAVEENHDYVTEPSRLEDQYRFYKSVNSADIEREFHAANQYRPTMRGIKVRGAFDTLEEAKIRAEVLKRMGDKFDIFVGQVGCWCPWSPNPEDLKDQVYAETQLNTLMKKYKENLDLKDTEFNDRRQAKMDSAKKANQSTESTSVPAESEEESLPAKE